jgi:prophage regulatory protein
MEFYENLTILKSSKIIQWTSIYLKISEGTFPSPISLGGRSVGWLESEIDAWIEERIAYTRRIILK